MKKIAFFLGLVTVSFSVGAVQIFDPAEPIVSGVNVFEVSENFADIYEKLDSIKWGGKGINVAIESLESLDKKAHIAATDERVVLVWGDSIIANYPKPADKDWNGYGQVTTALVLKFMERVPLLRSSESAMYGAAVHALVGGLDENGRYVYSKHAEVLEDGRILTSSGIEGGIDSRGNFRVSGIYKDSPADNAGIKSGDLITTINGAPVSVTSLTGFNSGTLKLGLLTPSGEKRIVLRRATVVLADADVVNRGSVLEIILHKISDNSVAIVNEALAKHDPENIIFDLRVAFGDDEKAMAKLAGLFLGPVPVMRVVETASAETEIVPGGNPITKAKMVVLVSGETRGTAEALAASFYENNRGVIVGTPTAGNARLATRLDLKNGGHLELLNKSIKTGNGKTLDGRGLFPIICLSNIRSTNQQGAFFLNVLNGDFNANDFNLDENADVSALRRGCPQISSGSDEDVVSAAVAAQILSDEKIYSKLINL